MKPACLRMLFIVQLSMTGSINCDRNQGKMQLDVDMSPLANIVTFGMGLIWLGKSKGLVEGNRGKSGTKIG